MEFLSVWIYPQLTRNPPAPPPPLSLVIAYVIREERCVRHIRPRYVHTGGQVFSLAKIFPLSRFPRSRIVRVLPLAIMK